MNDRLKKLIFDKLYMNLSDAEVIECGDTIWIIDRKDKYWYIEYQKSGELLWRFPFFNDFFMLFSKEESEYEPVIVEWVEEVLNNKVSVSNHRISTNNSQVEKVLNCKVSKSDYATHPRPIAVDAVLNYNNDN
jgi:hypothetical protein